MTNHGEADPVALTERYLRQMRKRGVRGVRLSPATREALARRPAGTPDEVPAPAPATPAAPAVKAAPRPAARPVITVEKAAAKAPAAVEAPGIVLPEGTRAERLAALRAQVLPCTRCEHLVKSRTQVVFGVGNPEARLMFVGEAPGADEDKQGEPFVGRAGQLLTKMIETMGLTRADVFIANVLKCRPDMPAGAPGNRQPTASEMATCLPYLRAQVEVIRPEVMVALGLTAVKGLLGREDAVMGRLRGTWQEFNGIPVMPTFHPAYLLRNQAVTEKRKVWEDLLAVMERLGMPISEKQRAFFTKA
jgi:DNA polymerase